MFHVRRLKVVGAVLALAAIVTTSHLWGDPAKQSQKRAARAHENAADQTDESFSDDLADSKFAKGGVVTYRTAAGDLLFAVQVKPNLEAAAEQPRDYAIAIDTSASQAGAPLTNSRLLAEALIKQAREQDRISIWTINTPSTKATRSLTNGFQPAKTKAVEDALELLKQEVPLGDTDLKGGVQKIAASFGNSGDRQQTILFLGDGMSVHNPITTADRTKMCEDMVQHSIVFFSVPMGIQFEPKNLHGLATGTGGTVVRVMPQDKVTDTAKRILDTLAIPILYSKEFKFTSEVVESFPTKLPPLRADAPTLVVGRGKEGKDLSYTLAGTVAGKEVRFERTEPQSAAEADNFFLISMLDQWKNAKDQPALTRADRALAAYFQQTQVTRNGLIEQAEWAIAQDKLEVARDLFQQARQIDPRDVEAGDGLKVVEKLRAGTLNKRQLKDQLAQAEKDGTRIRLAQAGGQAPPAGEIAPPVDKDDLLQQQKARTQVEQQRVSDMVETARREARRLLQSDPDAAHDILKRTYSAVRDNPDLSEATRQLLSNQLESALRSVDTQGIRIKSDIAERAKFAADSRRRLDLEQERTSENERTRLRMQRFINLMAQARYEDAYLQSLAIQQDAISTGRPVPITASAGYDIALAANNLTQIQELNRIRQERFLLTMMQVERSHIPFPDEPPIQFPPPQVWREITKLRKEKYESSGFTDDDPVALQRIREMKSKLNKPVSLDKGMDKNPLKDALEFLSDRYDITILVDVNAFKSDGVQDDVESVQVSLPKMVGVSLGTIMRLIASQVNGTFLIRRDYIEITTGQRAVAEKVVRVYPVADLVIPIPNSFNQRSIQNSLSIFGTAPGLGLNVGGPQALGALQFGGALGALGALGGGLGGALGGGLGALGGGLGALGGGFGGGFGGGLGAAGGLGAGGGGQINLGVGGGQLGFGGGQLGQFGNLGGQFGLQGGDQSLILVELIRQVVGNQKEWARGGAFQNAAALGRQGGNLPGQGLGQPPDEGDEDRLPPELLNNLGYYPPARALVVKGTSRIHTNIGGGLLGAKGGGGMGFLDRKRDDDKLVIRPGSRDKLKDKLKDDKSGDLLATNKGKDDKETAKQEKNSSKDAVELLAKKNAGDPAKIWQEALTKGIEDPGLVIACADFLAHNKQYEHLVEFLKANLRLGLVVRPWVYEALAMALEASQAHPDEIERARLSTVDLEPQDAKGYVAASKAMGQLKHYDRAVAFCRQAALLEPNAPTAYEEALLVAEMAKDTEAMEWAAGGLLRRDWPVDNEELHQKANSSVQGMVKELQSKGRVVESQRMARSVEPYYQRDLIVNLSWQGDADLDLKMKEPIGTTCSFMQRQTPGGGILLGDTLDDMSHESYVLARGFSGEYQITIERIWGRPLGGKATLEIIQHQGTPRMTRRRETISFDRSYTTTVILDDGRRTSAAYVPPANAERKRAKVELSSSSDVLNKLRELANPEFSGRSSDHGIRGALSSLGLDVPAKGASRAGNKAGDVVMYQTKVPSAGSSSIDLTAQATVGSDQSVTLKFTPVFQSAGKGKAMPAVSSPFIPGGSEASGGD